MTTEVEMLAERSQALGNQIHELCKGQGPTVIMTALCVCLGKALAIHHQVTGSNLEAGNSALGRVVLGAAQKWLADFGRRVH